jgi:anti-sigma factor RsiW
MSETHPNLVAWLDGELSPLEAAGVVLHLESCDTCRRQCDAFRSTSASVRLYSDAVFTAANTRPRLPRWVPALAALAAAAVVTILLAFPRPHSVTSLPTPSPVAAITPDRVSPSEPLALAASKPIRRHHSASPVPQRAIATWPSAETAVEIAIPADAVFAPGAVPEGMRLVGEMRIGPDGSLREIRLRQ